MFYLRSQKCFGDFSFFIASRIFGHEFIINLRIIISKSKIRKEFGEICSEAGRNYIFQDIKTQKFAEFSIFGVNSLIESYEPCNPRTGLRASVKIVAKM